MHPNLFQALGESRIRDWHELAARQPGRRVGSRGPAPVSSAPADEQAAVAADRQPAGSRAA
jgi:hypothetical protein